MDGSQHILVVADDHQLRKLLSTFLTSSGFHVSTAANGPAMAQVLDTAHIKFEASGTWSPATMAITPFGKSTPALEGKLMKTARQDDGVPMMRVDGLPPLPGLDGPAATVARTALQVEAARRRGRIGMLDAALAGYFGDSFILIGAVSDRIQDEMLDVEACERAKLTFASGTG